MDIKQRLLDFGKKLKSKLVKLKQEIKNDDDLLKLVKVSANNDQEIAENSVKIVRAAGEYGRVIYDSGYTPETKIIEDNGFIIPAGMFKQELKNSQSGFMARYHDVPVIVLNKKLYYVAELEYIVGACVTSGHKNVVIVAEDFIGDIPDVVINTYQAGKMNILLVKDPNVGINGGITLDDLAIYLGTKVHKTLDKSLNIKDFAIAKSVISDMRQTIIGMEKVENKALSKRIEGLKKELKDNGDKSSMSYKELEGRLASLTTGMITLVVGGYTPLEVQEKLFRYDDAINAGRVAVKDGYLVGGGLSILNAFKACKFDSKDIYYNMFKKLAEANIRQIAENCGVHPDSVMEVINTSGEEWLGYNAVSESYEDLKEVGIYDPYLATELAIDNSISVANIILTSKYLVLNDLEKEDK